MYFPFRQDGSVKESMLGTSTATVLDPGSNGRPFSSTFTSAQNQGANPSGFHHGGSLQSLHNVQGAYNLQNMQNALSSRNTGLGVPASATAQPSGNLSANRFTSSNLPGGLPQISHNALHGHNVMGARGALNVNHQFSSSINGVGTGPGGNNQGAGGNIANVRGSLGGLTVNPSQLGAAGARLGTQGVSMAGGGGVQNMGGSGGGGVMNRSVNSGAAMNLAALNGSRGMGSVGLGPLGSSGVLGIQGPGRPAAGNMLQQGLNMPSSTYSPSGDLLAMISRGQPGGVLLGNNFSTAPGSNMQGQPQGSNGQLGALGLSAADPVTSEGLAFDINEFPSLSTRPSSASGVLGPAAAALRKNAAVNAIVQHNAEFSIQNEDFPALPGFKAGGGADLGELHKDQHDGGGLGGLQSQHFTGHLGGQQIATHSVTTGLRNLSVGGAGSGLSQYEQLVSQHQFQQQQAQHQQSQLRVGPHQQQVASGTQLGGKDMGRVQGLQGGHDQFGLLGLLSVIRMSDADLTTLALGTDLTTLGLNLNSRENLYKTFASPWAEGPMRGEPEFTLPACYIQPAPRLQPGYFAKFQQDTLFYIFYSMPNDEAQLYAADELINRGWFYHKEHQMWFMRLPNTEPLVKTAAYERGSYYFFDPTVWETGRKDNFVLQYEMLEARPTVPPPQR